LHLPSKVPGLVIPDHFRLDRTGRKHIAIRSLPNEGTFEQQAHRIVVARP
jgi:hypothetical protein